ncbi:MAG: ribosome silencing factor [Leptolyngbyaceae cyanobacterium T60_A2020_046]|nr:ribosome silencing factor [Leptolyngbyaceae cyanobacterium T60_A2020_046]
MSDFPPSVTPFRTAQAGQPSVSANPDDALALARTIAQAADERKGGDIRVLYVADVSYLADYFVIVTGYSAVQVRAIARTIEDAVAEAWQRLPLRTEGQGEGRWVLQDYGEVIVHIFMPEEREFYSLEAFWGHAETVSFAAAGDTQ